MKVLYIILLGRYTFVSIPKTAVFAGYTVHCPALRLEGDPSLRFLFFSLLSWLGSSQFCLHVLSLR